MARLIWKQTDGTRKTFPLGDDTVVGRDEGTDCRIDAPTVSRRHARLRRRDRDFSIEDLESRNGTLLNGEPVSREVSVRSGDAIRLGDEVLELEFEAPSGAPTRGSLVTEPLARESGDVGGQGEGNSAGARLAAARAAAREGEELPRRLGKFWLLARLGQGGMGVVYRAIDLDSNREVAVKFIRTRLGRNEAFLDFFHNREAVLAREIDHPNIISVFEHGVWGDQHYISMEFVPGENLYQALKRRSLEPAEVLEVLRQSACGLAAAHRRGVVHSDIKPANILIGTSGTERAGPDVTAIAARSDERQGLDMLEYESEPSRDARSERYEVGLLDAARQRLGDPPRDVVLDPPFFPRPSEAGFLEHYFQRALEGRGYFILVEGEAGTGKKRLLSEFLRVRSGASAPGPAEVGSTSVRFHELDCSRIEGLPQLYEQFHGLRPRSQFSPRLLVEELTGHLRDDPTPRVVRLLNLGSATPLACEWIQSVAPLMATRGLLLVGALDPAEIRENWALRSLLERMTQVTKELYLRPLTEYQIQRYLQQMFPEGLAPGDLASSLHRLSRGNFAKLLEILRGFFDRGVLTIDAATSRLAYRPRAQEFELEEGKGLYEKYRAHGKFEQRVLEQAAFIGPRFLFHILLRLNDINETSLFFIVRTLLQDGFFVEESRPWYSFANSAFQRYLAERVSLAERQPFHRKIARLLHSVSVPECPELCHLRARHLSGIREHARAVEQLLEGAYLARNEYKVDLFHEMVQEVLGIYRQLSRQESSRREVVAVLRDWFRRDGNWYEILGEASGDFPVPRIKITDFGISFRMKDEEEGYQVHRRPLLGTPRYMAPERAQGEYGGFKSDIFSLGIISFEAASGRPPFGDLKGNDVIRANEEAPISLPKEVLALYPQGMEALMEGMLEKDPGRRWDAEKVAREAARLQLEARGAAGR